MYVRMYIRTTNIEHHGVISMIHHYSTYEERHNIHIHTKVAYNNVITYIRTQHVHRKYSKHSKVH